MLYGNTKNSTTTAITLAPDSITKTQLKQFWKEHGETKVKQLTDKAQLCIYDAWEADSISTILKLARKAFKISPFCLDAYNLLAEYEAETYTISKKLYEQAVYAGVILPYLMAGFSRIKTHQRWLAAIGLMGPFMIVKP